MSETTKPEHQVRRSGLQSSEFWLSILALAASTILPVLVDEIGKLVASSPYSALTPAIIAAGYALSRALVKKSRNDASATVAAKATEANCDDESARSFSDGVKAVKEVGDLFRFSDEIPSEEITPFGSAVRL